MEQVLLEPMFDLPSEEREDRAPLRITRKKVEEILGIQPAPISAAG
jgi:ATP-dependent Clp protease ATP-binding subunit ClpX